mmetsp:Transcript_26230/g.57365  ORF Transcript_26230/g.57365 Transcript_26230/m.57365 type:complete len:204 (+) Transcript_26230:396-1007(+)
MICERPMVLLNDPSLIHHLTPGAGGCCRVGLNLLPQDMAGIVHRHLRPAVGVQAFRTPRWCWPREGLMVLNISSRARDDVRRGRGIHGAAGGSTTQPGGGSIIAGRHIVHALVVVLVACYVEIDTVLVEELFQTILEGPIRQLQPHAVGCGRGIAVLIAGAIQRPMAVDHHPGCFASVHSCKILLQPSILLWDHVVVVKIHFR